MFRRTRTSPPDVAASLRNQRTSQPATSDWSALGFQTFAIMGGFKMQVKENHKWWYKPHITREDAINLLKSRSPGTFIVRDSNTFPDSFGLALKVLLTNTYQRFPIVSGGNPTSEWATTAAAQQRSAEFRGAGQTHSLYI